MGKRSKRAPHRRDPAAAGLGDVLFSKTQQRVFGLIFGQPERAFTVGELIRLAQCGSGAVQREVARLVRSGLVIALPQHKRYRANRDAPIFRELKGIVDKTVGIPEIVRAAVAPLADRVAFAILYGSAANASETALSDVDVLIVSDDLDLEELLNALAVAEKRLDRRVAPTLYTRAEFRRRRRDKHPFVTKVLARDHVVLFGDVNAAEAAR